MNIYTNYCPLCNKLLALFVAKHDLEGMSFTPEMEGTTYCAGHKGESHVDLERGGGAGDCHDPSAEFYE